MNRPSARTNFPNRPSRRSRSRSRAPLASIVLVLVLDPLLPPAQKRGPVRFASPAITPPSTQAQSKIIVPPSIVLEFTGYQQKHASLPSFTSVLPQRPAFHLRLHRSRARARRRARSRSPTATSREARTCPLPCAASPAITPAIHSAQSKIIVPPFNRACGHYRARVHWISAKAKARVAAFVHVCSPTANPFLPATVKAR